MTEVGEAVLVAFLKKQDKLKCDFKPANENWTANLEGNSTTLAGNLDKIQKKPEASRESELSEEDWPSQAHHLIPHLTLARHSVAGWLKKAGDSIMWGDTFYNVDHENNGRWLPYASALPEWQTANAKGKQRLRAKVMRLSGLQYHTSSHSKKNDYGVGEQPYQVCVTKYLDKVENNAVSHYRKKPKCEDCKDNSNNGEVPPRANTVRFVDRVSDLLWDDIRESRIFVSRFAAEFAECEGF